jgi:hypothetical protein
LKRDLVLGRPNFLKPIAWDREVSAVFQLESEATTTKHTAFLEVIRWFISAPRSRILPL